MKTKNNLFRWAYSYLRPFFPVLFLLCIFALVVNYVSTFEPMFTGRIIDSLTVQDRDGFFFYLKIIIIFQVASLGFSLLNSLFNFLLHRRMTMYTEGKLYISLLHTQEQSTTEQDSGKILNLFLSDLATMTGIFTSQIPSIIIACVMMGVLGFRLFRIDAFLFVLTLVVSVVPVLLAKYFGKRQAAITKEQRQKQDAYTSYIVESLTGLSTIQQYKGQPFFIKKFKHLLKDIFIHVKRSTIVGMQSFSANFLSGFSINIALFAIVGLTVLAGKNTVGTITAALLYSQKFRALVSSCAETYKGILISLVSVERVKTLFDKHNNTTKKFLVKESSAKKEIKIENLNYRYDENKTVLQNFNARFLFPGLYLVKGANGTGKTTLLKILANLVKLDNEYSSGKVEFVNIDEKIGYVGQDSYIFSGSILENICFNNRCDEKALKEILQNTMLQETIDELPNGINTVLGKNAHTLSQGQSKRLILSRCLYHDAKVLLLDEPETALDVKTLSAVEELLLQLKRERLVIVVTHRNSFDKIADSIVEIEG